MVEKSHLFGDHGVELERIAVSNQQFERRSSQKTQGLRQVFSNPREQKRVLRQRLTRATLAGHKFRGRRNAVVARHTTVRGLAGWLAGDLTMLDHS